MITNLTRALSGLALLASCALAGCETVQQDDFMSQDGISPDPTAVIEGSIVYNGPPPACVYEGGQPKRVLGWVVLNMYNAASPPFPEGSATGAVNLMVVLGERLFALADCLPEGATPDASTPKISRSTPFVWSRLVLSDLAETSVQIRAFYDHGEDFNPLFQVLRGPTVGDVLGSARNDVTDESKGYATLEFPRMSDVPNGVVNRGVTVLIDQPIVTERPAFRLSDEHKLSADAPFVPGESAVASLRAFRALTCSDPARGNGVSCGLSVSLLPRSDGPKLEQFKIRLAQTDARAYALYVDGVDLSTVRGDDIDRPGADGRIDPHPALGPTLGVDWYAPMVFFTRRKTTVETNVGIPDVRFVGSLLLDEDAPVVGTSLGAGPVPVVVPPMAFVDWTTNGGVACRVPYVAPRTPASVTSGRLAHCGELPTGAYDVSLVAGSLRGLPGTPGSRASLQQWTVPNELGDLSQVGGAAMNTDNVIASQSVAGTFQIIDPAAEPSRASCEAQQGKVCPGTTLPVVEPEPGKGLDSPTCLPQACCDAIKNLCNVPLCPRVAMPADGTGAKIDSPTSATAPLNVSDKGVPNCVPFELPRQCCPAAR